jgi:hypothetical protein
MWSGFRGRVSCIIGGIRPLLGHIGLVLFVMIGMALMGGIYVFGRLMGLAKRSGNGPFPGPELQYSRPRTSYTASALERQTSIESAE